VTATFRIAAIPGDGICSDAHTEDVGRAIADHMKGQ